MTTVVCADVSCKYNDNMKCKRNRIVLNYHSRSTVEGREEFRSCEEYEESDRMKEFKKLLEKAGGINGERT